MVLDGPQWLNAAIDVFQGRPRFLIMDGLNGAGWSEWSEWTSIPPMRFDQEASQF